MQTMDGSNLIVIFCGISGLLTLSLASQETELCELLKADPRDTPAKMNSGVGSSLNLFPDLKVPVTGKIKFLSFYAIRRSYAYVSFWEDFGNHTFKLVTKIKVNAEREEHVQFEPASNHLVQQGNVLAIHYENGNGWTGLISYERGGDENPTGVPVYTVYNPDNKDNGWDTGKILSLGAPSARQKNVALHVKICTCANNTYGEDCHLCSEHCLNSPCNKTSGHCEGGCSVGYQGNSCDQACSTGTYGSNCSNDCSSNCLDNEPCNHVTGECDNGCLPGYYPPTCEQSCVPHMYGENCSSQCSDNCRENQPCNLTTGNCDNGCKDGFYETENCTIACEIGTYGHNCSQTCSGHCVNGEQCATDTGRCAHGCEPGYDYRESVNCDKECRFQTFGESCNSECHCASNSTCNKISGICPYGCADGWEGPTCSAKIRQEENKGTGNNASNKSGLLAGIVILFLVCFIAASFIVFLLWKRFKYRKPKKYEADADEININYHNEESNSVKGDPEQYLDNGTSDVNTDLYVNTPVAVVKPTTHSRPMAVREMHDVVKHITQSELEDEYKKFPKDQTKEWTFATKPELVPKNKFKNILPYDDNRVVLDQEGGNPLTQYINASFIPGYDKRKKYTYIASQGPQKTTVDDFWRMVWQYEVYTIVMLTNLVEKMKIKCVQYWPTEGVLKHGGVEISLEKETTWGDIVTRHLKVTKKSETRNIRQFQYTGWPDHGAPDSTRPILALRNEVNKYHKNRMQHPILVHCSAGVGRTGTYISLDYLLQQAHDTETVDVLKCVHSLRCSRVNMVQSFAQYRFIYNTLDEHFALGQREINGTQCVTELQELLQTKEGQNKLQVQYQFLEDMKPVFTEDETQIALNNGNVKKNRDPTVVPTDNYCLALESEDGKGGDYINAIAVEGFKEKGGYVVTQVPLKDTRNEFWRLLMENNIQTVVYLKDRSDADDDSWLPKKGDGMELGIMSAVCHNVRRTGNVDIAQIEVGRLCEGADEGAGDIYANVKQAVYENKMESNAETMQVSFHIHQCINVNDEGNEGTSINTLQRLVNENVIAGQPVAVMCLNGAKDSGTYIACDMFCKMLAKEPTVDLFNIVQRIRTKRPQFICNLEQYQFLHKFGLTHASNVKSNSSKAE